MIDHAAVSYFVGNCQMNFFTLLLSDMNKVDV